MATRRNGGIRGVQNRTTISAASGAWSMDDIQQSYSAHNWPGSPAATVPNAPAITSVSATSATTASLSFTLGYNGGSTITSVTAVSVPGNIVGTLSGISSPITFSGLTPNTTYSFYIYATNSVGNSAQNTSGTITTPNAVILSSLVVAGGGGGGVRAAGGGGGGGGAGGMIPSTSTNYFSVATPITVTVGAGGPHAAGTPGSSSAFNGSNSVFGSLTAIGGGGGGWNGGDGVYHAGNGGSGGGGTTLTAPSYGTGTSGQGNNGGSATYTVDYGAGGGGAGAVGQNSLGTTAPIVGAGGNGLADSITGSSVTYAGGGAGISYYNDVASGGTGGGGSSGNTAVVTNGTANSGGGGGATYSTTGGGNGGSGIVIIQYLKSGHTAATGFTGLTYTDISDATYFRYSFTAGTGTITIPS